MPSPTTTGPAAARRYRRLERDARREQILACARGLFSTRSYATVSSAEIAAAAGVTRGLLHHYFGTKRELYLEVVREMVHVPPPELDAGLAHLAPRERWEHALDRWLDTVQRNRATWLATLGAEGFGRDPGIEAVLERAREAAGERLLAIVGVADRGPRTRALVRAYGGLAEAATVEWLARGRLRRDEVRRLLVESLMTLLRDVLPHLRGAPATPTQEKP
jgi:AcrR family transcriptional regulator